MSDKPFEDAYRTFEPLVGGCWYCRSLSTWLVTEKESLEQIETCDDHQFTAFS